MPDNKMIDNKSEQGVTVNILDKEYLIACPVEERNALLSAARLLDRNMREIRSSGKVIGSDRIAVMAGLNIAHDLLTQNTDSNINSTIDSNVESSDKNTKSRINAMQDKIDRVLGNQHELEL
jgi:cell division protein ZapA